MDMDFIKLNKKKNLTGQEVGKALIYYLLLEIQRKKNNTKHPVKKELLNSLINKLLSTAPEKEKEIYSCYRRLSDDLIELYNTSQTYEQQFFNGFSANLNLLENIKQTEILKENLSKYPLLLTKNQYTSFSLQVKKEKEKQTNTYNQIVTTILNQYFKTTDDTDIKPIAKELKKLVNKPINDTLYKKIFSTLRNKGHFELADGRKPTEKALKELETITGYNQIERKTQLCKLFYMGATAVKDEYKKTTGNVLKGTNKDITEAIDLILSEIGYYTPLACELDSTLYGGNLLHWKRDQSEKLDSYSFITFLVIKNLENTSEILKKYYPDLYKAIDTYITNNIKSKAPTLKELEAQKIYGYAGVTIPSDEDIIKAYKEKNKTTLLFTGIAFVKEPFQNKDIFSNILSLDSLEATETFKKTIYNNSLVESALCFINAFNCLLKALEGGYQIENLQKLAKFDMKNLLDKVNDYNSQIYIFYACTDDKTRQEKIKKMFTPVKTELFSQYETITDTIKENLKTTALDITKQKRLAYYYKQYVGR